MKLVASVGSPSLRQVASDTANVRRYANCAHQPFDAISGGGGKRAIAQRNNNL